jgi:peptidoglycan hydrolase-like protein with peptidoglycan-binding domain
MSEELRPLVGSMVAPIATPAEEPKATPALAQEPKVVEVKEVKKESKSTPKVKREANVIVSLSALKVNALAGNSSSVQTVQLRLKELGFDAVVLDKFGRLGAGSVDAVNAYRKSVGLAENGLFDEEVLAYLFDGVDVGVGA